ncbi:unnamed protein product [Chrysoparadoxa australica]
MHVTLMHVMSLVPVASLLITLLAPPAAVEGAAHVARRKPVRFKRAYDTNVRAFSPDGSIYQVEYAGKAVDKGSLTVGVQCKGGVVLAAHKKERSCLVVPKSVSKLSGVARHACVAMSGLIPDGRMLVDHARAMTIQHWFEFGELAGIESIASAIASTALSFNGYRREDEDNDKSLARPVGVALLLGGWDHTGPTLYHVQPSGSFTRWRAKAIGKKSDVAEAKIESLDLDYDDAELNEAITLVLQVFLHVLGEKDFDANSIEVMTLDAIPQTELMVAGGETEFRVVPPEELQKLWPQA